MGQTDGRQTETITLSVDAASVISNGNCAERCDAVQMLLQYGADPRLYAEDGLTPAQQSSFEHVRNVLDSWDISLTDGMLQRLQADRDKQRDDDRQMTAAETQRLETQLLAAEKEYATAEKQVRPLNTLFGPGKATGQVHVRRSRL